MQQASKVCVLGSLLYAALLAGAGGAQETSVLRSRSGGQGVVRRSATRSAEAVPTSRYKLMVDGAVLTVGGFRVSSLNLSGPCARMEDDRGNTGALESGDIILAIDSVRIDSDDQMVNALNAGATQRGFVTLSVMDRRQPDRPAKSWRVVPARVSEFEPAALAPPRGRATAVKVVLIGDTHDQQIGSSVNRDIGNLRQLLQSMPHLASDDIHELSGPGFDVGTILRKIDSLQVNSTDCLFCYVCSHGAYDQRLAVEDTASQGHYIAFRTNSLPRRALRERLRSKGARMTVLISDSCNVSVTARRIEYRQVIRLGDNPVLASLFLDHVGLIDVNSASRDQSAFGNSNDGGFFTSSFYMLCDPGQFRDVQFVTWDHVLPRVRTATSEKYRATRTAELAFLRQTTLIEPVERALLDQQNQEPQIFVQDVRRVE